MFFFHKHFLNTDISLNISYITFRFSTYAYEIRLQGRVSQIFDLGPSLYFM